MLEAVEGRGLRTIIRFFSFIIIAVSVVSFDGGFVFAQAVGTATRDEAVPETCDAEFMKSLEARAWMEGEREGIQNQSLIVKPDSVMHLACLGSWLDNTALDRGLFSEGLGAESMDEALTVLVKKAFLGFMRPNFRYRYFGGRSEKRTFFDDTVIGARYNCPQMNAGYDHAAERSVEVEGLWYLAKCYNFQPDDQPQDGFFNIKQYAYGEVSSAPSGDYYLEACEPDGRWETMYKLALEEPPWWPLDWAEQRRPTYHSLLDPPTCSGHSPRPTGIIVRLADGTEFPDAFCSAPGCWYDRSNCVYPP